MIKNVKIIKSLSLINFFLNKFYSAKSYKIKVFDFKMSKAIMLLYQTFFMLKL